MCWWWTKPWRLAMGYFKKVHGHLKRLKERGTSVLLVTHSFHQIIQHCDQALLLHKGKARMLGEPAKITVTYQQLINASDAEWDEAFADPIATPDARTSLAPQPTTPKTGYNAEA